MSAIFSFRIFLSAFFHPHPPSAVTRSPFYRHPFYRKYPFCELFLLVKKKSSQKLLLTHLLHKGAWYWKGSSCNAGTLCLNSGQLCHGRQFRAWLWTARFWDQKVSYCYTNVCVCFFLFFFFIFGSFLISWANWVLLNLRFVLDDFKGERLPHAQRKRWDVKNMFLDLISTNPYFSSGFGWIGLV